MPRELFIAKVLKNCANKPDKTALIRSDDGLTVSYGELKNYISGAREALIKANVRKGDRVMLNAAHDFNFIFLYLALHSMGAVAVPLDPGMTRERYLTVKESAGPVLCLWSDASMPDSVGYDAFLNPADEDFEIAATEDDLADIMFTSGTTGKPKGVALKQATIAAAVNNINMFIGNGEDDIELCPMPLSHSFGLARIRCNLYAGATLVLENGVSRPKHLFQSLDAYNVTGLSMVGAAWTILSRLSGDKLGNFANRLKYVELGSAPLPPESKARLASLLPNTKTCMHYGLTEASRAAFLDFRADSERLESVGRASPLCEIAIFSPDGEKLAAGEEGEVCVRGDIVFPGYLEDEHNREAFFPGGYMRTGDLGLLDENGYLRLTGRIKEMINVAGEKVSPYDVERELEACPGVGEAACVAMPDPLLGEAVAAFIVPAEDASPDPSAILSALKNRLQTYQTPKIVKIIERLPRTVSGKIQRAALKERL